MLPKIGKSLSLSEHAYLVIKDAILNNKIRPKEILSEEALADQLGISRTPLRTALKKLEFEKLIYINSSKNAVVADIARADMDKVFVIRLALEPVAARITCSNINEAKIREIEENLTIQANSIKTNDLVKFMDSHWNFHLYFARYSENELLLEMIERTMLYTQRFLMLSMTMPQYAPIAFEEHQAIVNALKTKSPALAEANMLLHIKNSASRLAD